MSKFDSKPTVSSLSFCFLCFRPPIAQRWLCIPCAENGNYVPNKFSRLNESGSQNITASALNLASSISPIEASTLSQCASSNDSSLSQIALSSSSEQSRGSTLADLIREVDNVRQKREKLSRRIESELLDKKRRVQARNASAERTRLQCAVRELHARVEALRRQLQSSREKGRLRLRETRELVKRTAQKKQRAEPDLPTSRASLEKLCAKFASKRDSLQARRASLVRQVVDFLQLVVLQPPPAAPDCMSMLPPHENVDWTQVEEGNAFAEIPKQLVFESLDIPTDSLYFKQFLDTCSSVNTAQCATADASEKVTREPLKRLIATSVYLHVLLSAIHWILEPQPLSSSSPSLPQVSREHLMCAHETPSYWLARWWRLERAFLDVARAQQLPPLDSSGAGASSPLSLSPSQLGSNLKLLADYPLLGRHVAGSGRVAIEQLPPAFHEYFSLRKQLLVLFHLHAGRCSTSSQQPQPSADALQLVRHGAELPEESDLLDVRECLLSADELRELLQAVRAALPARELSDLIDTNRLLAPAVGSDVCSSMESCNCSCSSDHDSLGERRASSTEGPAPVVKRRASLGDDWDLADGSDIEPMPNALLAPTEHRPQRASVAALFVSTSSSLSHTIGHLSSFPGALYRSSIGGFPTNTNADEESDERTPQRQSFSEDASPASASASASQAPPSADAGGESGAIVPPNQQMSTSIWNWALGRQS